ncbi:cysteine proteinase [Pleomassaria siparia CBS 279.74]|uniref:Cysteine proteinase n=1 Tax=Pleomassaria siparia CBS 279.74 TaxID=1314801 RepID=A0A6G1JQY4_9PLEO|nr:cysteine proteinase [Pleomassaria siparia CBS 279.74]
MAPIPAYISATRAKIANAKASLRKTDVLEALNSADTCLEQVGDHNEMIAPVYRALKKKKIAIEKELEETKDKNVVVEGQLKAVERRNEGLKKALDEAKILIDPYKEELKRLRALVKELGGEKVAKSVEVVSEPAINKSLCASANEDSSRKDKVSSQHKRKCTAEPDSPRSLKKIALQRQSRPPSLENRTGNLSHSNTILQGLAGTIDASRLSREHRANASSATKAFISLISEMQKEQRDALKPDYFQALFAKARKYNIYGKIEEDAAEYLQQLLSSIECESISDAFNLRHHLRGNCPNHKCGSNIIVDSKRDGYILSLSKPSPHLLPKARPNESTSRTTLHKLLHEKLWQVAEPTCQRCGMYSIQCVWKGLLNVPRTIIMRFERAGAPETKTKLDYALDLPASIDMKDYLPEKTNPTRYTLSTVIKHRGHNMQDGRYVAYTMTDDGQWWQCEDDRVSRVEERAFQGRRGGETYLAFYKQNT